jgi:serine/threonine-protein kinase
VITAGAFAVTFAAGYLISAFIIFPAPIFARTEPVPRVVGLANDAAQEALRKAGFAIHETEPISHPTAENGVVVWQDPPAGVAVRVGTTVDLSWSRGPQRVPVPDLSGYEQALAQRLVSAAGLRVARRDTTQSAVPRGVVVNTRPPAGTTLLPGTGLTLVVSVGAPILVVPDLSGLTVDEANAVLSRTGLVLGTVDLITSSAGPPGTIFIQDPAAGTLSAAGASVSITIVREGLQ